MSIPVKLPALGESVVEGTLSRWLVGVGDRVEVDQTVCEVTTDKVDAEIPAPVSGRIERILVPEGSVVAVGAELALVDECGPCDDAAPRSDSNPAVAPEPRRATPVARRLAEQADLSMDRIRGTGAAGRITKSDVLSHGRIRAGLEGETSGGARAARSDATPTFAPASSAPAAERVPRGSSEPARETVVTPTASLSGLRIELEEGDRVVPMSVQRRLTAAHMVYSKHTSPHVGTVAEVDFGAVAALRKQHAERFRAETGTALTFLPFVAHAAVHALREHRALNVSVAGDAIVERRGIHLSVAVETEKGLLAPVVRNADHLSLTGLVAAIAALSERARTRRLGPDDLRGGTFTVSNPGRTGNLYGFAIINQPQVGILRMGELVKRPVVRSVDGQDAIVIRPLMHLALSYDHRAVDGAGANAFLFRIRERLESGSFEL
jgi:2-oxoglutarate dehydrogenase E2 component (dihydrolipoamide succinyltransferase)